MRGFVLNALSFIEAISPRSRSTSKQGLPSLLRQPSFPFQNSKWLRSVRRFASLFRKGSFRCLEVFRPRLFSSSFSPFRRALSSSSSFLRESVSDLALSVSEISLSLSAESDAISLSFSSFSCRIAVLSNSLSSFSFSSFSFSSSSGSPSLEGFESVRQVLFLLLFRQDRSHLPLDLFPTAGLFLVQGRKSCFPCRGFPFEAFLSPLRFPLSRIFVFLRLLPFFPSRRQERPQERPLFLPTPSFRHEAFSTSTSKGSSSFVC